MRDQRAGDGEALALAARQVRAAFFDHGVIALRQADDEFVRPGEFGGGDHPFERHGGIGQRDVLTNRAVEQQVLLQHHADLAAQPGRIDLSDIDSIDQDAPALRHVQPLEQLGQGRFARA